VHAEAGKAADEHDGTGFSSRESRAMARAGERDVQERVVEAPELLPHRAVVAPDEHCPGDEARPSRRSSASRPRPNSRRP